MPGCVEQKQRWWDNCWGGNRFVWGSPTNMKNCPEVHATEKWEAQCNPSMPLAKQRGVWNSLKKIAPTDNSSELQVEQQ